MNLTDSGDKRGETKFNRSDMKNREKRPSGTNSFSGENGVLSDMKSQERPNSLNDYGATFANIYEIENSHLKEDDVNRHMNGAFTYGTDFGRGEAPTVIDIPDRGFTSMTSEQKASFPRTDTEDMEDIDTWLEFSQATTFHGIRYIFHPKNLRQRKYLWITVVAAAVFLFIYQVVDRGNNYFSYRSNVNVEVVYTKEIEFPSVTLCNQNNYRLTETVRRGMYSFIDGVYSGLTLPPENQTTGMADDLWTFVTKSAHQKQDFIDSCRWKGEPCDMENDVITTFTDFGVCYTFNYGRNGSVLKISKSGSGFALGLVLNIEQYEYMNGPHDQAGMKVLLHDPSEIPQVQNQGFAIAPGTHTLVAVSREQIYSLQPPYGTCDLGAVPRSQCIAECRAKDVAAVCGCRDAHMPNITMNNTAVDICPEMASYICLKEQEATFLRSGRACKCSTPCHRVVYTPELSYSHLSHISVDKLWLKDDLKRRIIQQRYTDARETTQRVNDAIARADTLRYTTLLESSRYYYQSLTDFHELIRDTNTLERVIGSRKNPLDGHSEIEADMRDIESEHSKLWTIRTSEITHPDMKELRRLIFYIDHYFLVGHFGVLRRVEECADLQALGDPTSEEFKAKCDTKKQPLHRTMQQANPERAEYLPGAETSTRRFIKVLNMSISEYQNVIRTLYENTTVWDDVIVSPDHLECLELLANTSNKWIPKFTKVKHQFSTYYYTDSFAKRREISYDMWALSNWTKTSNESLTRKDMFKICSWYQVGKDAKDPAMPLYKQYAVSVRNALLDSLGLLKSIAYEMKNVKTAYQRKSAFLFGPFKDFMTHNKTKMDLYNHLKSFKFTETFNGVEITNSQVQTDASSYASRLQDVEYNLNEALKYAFNFSVWVMRNHSVQRLKFMNFIKKNYQKNKFIQTASQRLSYENSSLLYEVITHVFRDYRMNVLDRMGKVTKALARLEDQVVEARSGLEEFEKGNQLNEQFFMENYIKVDIFYKELSYVKISQQVAFEFTSYLSEVGGFLGLLLGASVLTVCEFVDYITLALMRRCRAKEGK